MESIQIIQMGMSIFGVYWFFIAFSLLNYMIKTHPELLKSKSILQYFFTPSDGVRFFKEQFNPSHREDKKYLLLINLFRIPTLLFIILGVIWAST